MNNADIKMLSMLEYANSDKHMSGKSNNTRVLQWPQAWNVVRYINCPNCGEVIWQGDWTFDEEEREPRCWNCNELIDLPEGW